MMIIGFSIGIRLFNNTQNESLSLLNNSIGLSKNVLGNESRLHLDSEMVVHYPTTDNDAHKTSSKYGCLARVQ